QQVSEDLRGQPRGDQGCEPDLSGAEDPYSASLNAAIAGSSGNAARQSLTALADAAALPPIGIYEGGDHGLDGHSQWHAERTARRRRPGGWRRHVASDDGPARAARLQGGEELQRQFRRSG